MLFIMPLPCGMEFEGAEVEWGEKEGDWFEESCSYSKLQHSLLVLKSTPVQKILLGERNCN